MLDQSKEELVFVLGGARSGKSSWGLHYAEERYKSPLFLATAEVQDREMAERVRLHREARGERWSLVEEPLYVPEALQTRCDDADVVMIDCMTIWLSNILLKIGEDEVPLYRQRLVDALTERRQAVIVVANEVGTGIVPDSRLGRIFRDHAGQLNQQVAAVAEKVIFSVAGIPNCIKGSLK